MSRCTFQSRQRFFRPPVDFTKRELQQHVERGLLLPLSSAGENGASPHAAHHGDMHHQSFALDQVSIDVDELSFDLDSHQFHTTLDLIRNVILAPPPKRSDVHAQTENNQEQE